MRSNTLIRLRQSYGATKQNDYIQDNVKPAGEPWEVKRARIARAAEEACNLPGNECGPDFEEFLLKYSKKSGSGSDFA